MGSLKVEKGRLEYLVEDENEAPFRCQRLDERVWAATVRRRSC